MFKASVKQALGHYKYGGLDLSIQTPAWSLGGFWSRKIGKVTEDFRISNVPVTKDQGSTDFCFPGGTKILLDDYTEKDIDKFQGFERVITHTGKSAKVIKTMKRVWQGNLHRIELWGHKDAIEASSGHPIFGLKNGSDTLDFIPIENLEEKDFVAVPFTSITKQPIEDLLLDERFLRVLGIFLAEGSFVKDNYDEYNWFVFSLNEKENLVEEIKKLLFDLFGLEPSIIKHDESIAIQLKFKSKQIANLLYELCGEYCDYKKLSKQVMFLEPKLQLEIFRGWFDGDGCYARNIVVTTSEELLKQMRLILLRNNIGCSTRLRSFKYEGRKDAYELFINNNEYNQIFKGEKQESISAIRRITKDNYLLYEVRSVDKNTYLGGNIYNLEVEGDNSYIASGVAVHNCVAFESSYTVEQDYPSLRLSAPFVFAAAKKRYYGGDYSSFGLGIVHGLGVLQHDGIPLESYYPFNNNRNKMANWHNISDEVWEDAARRKMTKGYFQVDVFEDKFENFCAAMKNWDEMVITGMKWYNGYYLDNKGRLILNKTGNYTGHSVSSIERKTIDNIPGIVFKNSYLNMPEFWLSAEQVRQEMYLGYIVLPIERDIAEIIKKYSGKAIMSNDKTKKEVFLVVEGKKCWLQNELIAWAHNIRLWQTVEVVPDEDLVSIPQGKNLTAQEGENYQILKEVFGLKKEKYDEFSRLIN